MMQVFKGLPEGTFVQLIEDNIVHSPAPIYAHQKAIIELGASLFFFVKQHNLGEVAVSPVDVYLDQKNAFQPDLIFISKDRLHIIERNGLHGAPDLVIEVLSPSTAKYDQQQKKNVYERCGVKEYWIIDPESSVCYGYQLIDGAFVLSLVETRVVRSPLLGEAFHF
jgi:Uma2 family endonuclease